MSPEQAKATAATSEAKEVSLLDQVLEATKQTERSRAEELIHTLADEALKGTVTYSKNVTVTVFCSYKGGGDPFRRYPGQFTDLKVVEAGNPPLVVHCTTRNAG